VGARPPGRSLTRFALLLPLALAGCGTQNPPGTEPSAHAVGANDPAWVTSRPSLPPPDLDRINYDERTRTLTLYDLPGNDRWLVRLPGEEHGRQTGPRLRVPAADLAEVYVYYVRPGMKPSIPVSVKQVRDSGGVHVSLR
jgi:hypothetical protein